jgi:hypothetical protein
MAAADKTLTDVLSLLTKVSSQLSVKIDKLEKMVAIKQPKAEIDNKDVKTKVTQTSAIDKLLATQLKQTEPEKVVEEETKVQVSSFGKDAEAFLTKLIGATAPKPTKPEKVSEEEGLVSKLMKFLPMIGLVLGGLGGFLASLLSGDFKNVLEQIKAGDFLGALQTAGKIIFKTIQPYIQSIPIIGPIYSFAQAYLEIEKGNIIPGLKYLAQGFVGLLPLPYAVKAAMIGGVEMIGSLVEKKYPEIKIPTGKGGDVLPIAFNAIGKILKFGVFKRLPVLGSAINFYEAYQAFESGGVAGVAKGLINLGSGIANLFPGYGTLISIGLDILSSLIFSEEEVVDTTTGKTVKRIRMTDFYNTILPYVKRIPFVGNLINLGEGIYDISNGDTMQGIKKLAMSLPFVGVLVESFEVTMGTYANIYNKGLTPIRNFYINLQKSILKNILMTLPDSFGIRGAVAKFFGISLNEVDASTENLPDFNLPTAPSRQTLEEDRQKQLETFLPPEQSTTLPETNINPNERVEDILNQQTKLSDENKKVLENLSEAQSSLLSRQLEMMGKQLSILNEIKSNLSKPSNNIVSSPTVISNNYNQGVSLRGIQGVPA